MDFNNKNTHAHTLSSFAGVFASVADTREGTILSVVGRPGACLLAEFIFDMILEGKYSIMESLVEHGFQVTAYADPSKLTHRQCALLCGLPL